MKSRWEKQMQCKKLLEEGNIRIKEDKCYFGDCRLLLHVMVNFRTELKFILAFKHSYLHLSKTSHLTTKFLHNLPRKSNMKMFFSFKKAPLLAKNP